MLIGRSVFVAAFCLGIAALDSSAAEEPKTPQRQQRPPAAQPKGAGAEVRPAAGEFKTPEACFEAFVSARRSGDIRSLLACSSEALQNQMVGWQAYELQRAAAAFRNYDKEIAQLYARHDLSDVNVMEGLQINPDQALHFAGERVTDKAAFLISARDVFERIAKEQAKEAGRDAPAPAPKDAGPDAPKPRLANIKIEGNTATATVVSEEPGAPKDAEMFFRKTGGGWLVGLARELPPGPRFKKAQRDALRKWNNEEQRTFELAFDEATPANGLRGIKAPLYGELPNGSRHADVTDQDLNGIQHFSTLLSAELDSSEITDAGAECLKPHAQLELLSLAGTNVTDKSVELLSGFNRLKSLDIRGTSISTEGARRLKAALPDCKILTGFWPGDASDDVQIHVERGRTVLLLVLKDGHKESDKLLGETLSGSEVTALVKRNRVVVLHVKATDELPDEVPVPSLLVFAPGTDEPSTLSGRISREQVLTALAKAGKSRPPPPPPKRKPKLPQDDPESLRALEELGVAFDWDIDGHITRVNLGIFRDVADRLGRRMLTDEDIGCLSRLKWLQIVDLRETAIHGEGLKAVAGLENVKEVWASLSELRDEGLKHLATLPKLEKFDAPGAAISDAGLKQLAACKSLVEVNLSQTAITDDGLAGLRNCRDLAMLDLSGTKVTSAGLVHLPELSALVAINLGGTKIDDAAAARLGRLESLVRVNLSATSISDKALADLGRLPKLQVLDLSGTRISDKGLSHLTNCKEIYELNLEDTGITDEGLRGLASLKELRELNVIGTKVSRAAVIKLRESCPNVTTRRGPKRANKEDFSEVETELPPRR